MNPWEELLVIQSSAKYPRIDGHFWVERNGKLIDPNFQSFNNLVCNTWNCEGPKVYLEAPMDVQLQILRWFKEASKCKQFQTWEAFVERFGVLTHECVGVGDRRVNCCWINSVLEYYEHGGRIVFGSMGWKVKNSETIHFEFGGANFTNVRDFLKK